MENIRNIKSPAKLITSFVLVFSAGGLGSIATTPKIDSWYQELMLPALAPPNWVFAPVWISLYILTAIALYLVWKEGMLKPYVEIGVLLFFNQLVLNTFWSWAFFGFESPGLGLIVITFLWVNILIAAIVFAKVSKPAAWLMAPYLAWVSFATYLNYAIWSLNPGGSI